MLTNISKPAAERQYSLGEELVNSITHGIGTGLAITALVLLIIRSVCYGPEEGYASCVTGYTLFGSTMVLLYLISTLYHSLAFTRAALVFRILDHSAIYLLIAGSYSAFALTILHGPLGWTLFGISWFLAVIGIVVDSVWLCRLTKISMTLYLLMGWLIILAIRPLFQQTPFLPLFFLAAGGISYTAGCLFFILDRRYMHGIWHLFVLAGSILQFFSAYFLLPMGT